MKMTAENFDAMARHSMTAAEKLAEQFKRGEITEEEQREGIRDEADFWACIYSPEEIAEGERLSIEESKRKYTDELREDYGTGTALEDLIKDNRKTAIDRLKCIPSELEVIYYLHDTGKILFDMVPSYAKEVNIYDGIDISFMDQEEAARGKTNLAGGDVKNTRYLPNNNFIIETQQRKKWGGKWEEWSKEYAWGKHVLNPDNRNRYIFYVRNTDFGQEKLIDMNKSERENAIKILEYYHNTPEKLDHVIEIIRAEDVRKFLSDHPEQEETAITEYCIGYLLMETDWIRDGLPALRITRTANGWKEHQITRDNPLIIQTEKYDTRRDISAKEKQLRADQAEGLSLGLLKSLFGLPDKLFSEAEINEQVKRRYDY